MEPMNQWSETVELLCKWWPETFWKHHVRDISVLYYQPMPFQRVVTDPTSLDSLAAISEAIGVPCWFDYSVGTPERNRYFPGYCAIEGNTARKLYPTGLYATPQEAMLAAVNAAVRYAAKKKEDGQ